MGCLSGIIKTVVCIFNFICLLIGLVLLVLGTLIYVAIDEFTNNLPGVMVSIPIVLIVVGVFIFLVSFLGCCGAIRSNKCMLMTYAIILIVILVIQLVVGIIGLVQVKGNYEEFKSEVNTELFKVFNKNDEASKAFMDSLQSAFDCCGVYSKNDYTTLNMYPGTCCQKTNTEFCSDIDVGDRGGCGNKFFSTIDQYITTISIVAIVICVIEFIAALLAIYLARKK